MTKKNKNIKILVTDDDNNLKETLSEILEFEGYGVLRAANVGQCLDIAKDNFLGVILMDYNLPDGTGIDAVKEIKKISPHSQIIMITAYASLDAAVRAVQESVYDFLIKPVDFDYLKRAVKTAVEKITLEQSNRELMEKLKERNAKLSELNNMKTKFFSIVSHDISNSMTVLRMTYDMLKKTIASPDEEQKKKMNFMEEGIEQVFMLVKDLVDWAAIEKGALRLDKTGFDLSDLVKSFHEVFKEKAEAKNIETFFNGCGRLEVFADAKRIKQILLNIAENALRHTPQNGSITISVMKIGDKNAKVSVKDTGCGISPSDTGRLFESFYQKGNCGRLGLGLSIAREIALSHGGKIWVESEGEGKGAAFSFILPLA
ncbi:MAG: hybrid sensor histidine kinase/response regulator [Elusimicrobiota bacterium]|jgi:signal transduction histidine kinase|nr:hybrid sensor histidine kinase/response regulator [Elusimicrobiota bacterium]